MPSLSRQLAAWVHTLRFEDLPPAVIDRAKGVTLHALASALLGYDKLETQQTLRMMQEEEAGGVGVARVLVDGCRMTASGAALVNAETIFSGGKWDTFRMLTHPCCAIVPAALVETERGDLSGKAYLTGLVAGYEVMLRMAADFIPTVMSRGFHAGPVFGIFGAAMALAKLQNLSAEQIHGTIAQCVNLASGNLEGARSGGRSLREGGAVRNALLAVAMGRQGVPGGETVLEGEAGFYHAYAGNNLGRLRYSFSADTRASLDRITEGLGERWQFLETLYRIYTTAGYNIAHVDVTAALCREHDIKADDVERIESIVNWLETEYPSPAFPTQNREPHVGSGQYYAAYGVVRRGFPLLKDVARKIGEADPPQVLELMHRVRLTPSHRQTLFGPTVTIHLKDGRSFTRAATGREFMWDFNEEVRRLTEIIPGIPISASQFHELTRTCAELQSVDKASRLVELTIK